MAELPIITKDMTIIGVLADYPTDSGGLTTQEFKDKFDEGNKAVKDYVNSELVPSLISDNIPFTPTEDIDETNVQAAIENVQRQAAEAVSGSIPNNTVSFDKLTDTVKARIVSHETDIARLDSYIPTITGTAATVENHGGRIETLESASSTHGTDIAANASAIQTKAAHLVTVSATLTSAGWSGNAQTVTVSGAEGKTAIVGIDSEASAAAVKECERCLVRFDQQIGNDIRFVCSSAPNVDIPVYVLILD